MHCKSLLVPVLAVRQRYRWPGTLMHALPPLLVIHIVGRAELDLVAAIHGQAEYDVETCLNLKYKNSLSTRQWNRGRMLLACYLDIEGSWVRKKVGVTK
jgi:hypothetical protein